jgi:uncharacterized repeat protein (TIGR03847 family)
VTEPIEFDPVDAIDAGAFGAPGHRTFVIQARKGDALLSVLVEKEQVQLLATEANEFLDRIASEDPEELAPAAVDAGDGTVTEDEPLFRARLIGIGYDPERSLVLIELREDASDEEDVPPEPEASPGHVARFYATRPQVRAMARNGARAVAAGRPTCELCGFPMNPEGHACPRWN